MTNNNNSVTRRGGCCSNSSGVTAAAAALVVVLAMAMACTCATAQCRSLTEYSPCLDAVTTGAEPTDQCCETLAGVMSMDDGLACLCDALTSDAASSLGIRTSDAVQLPSKCQAKTGLTYTHGYNCKGATVP
ncbi:uncharacterized protein [Physcomitrium patens]|uniref:Bifunctional inhibitor/plant lipid transfer protein/seed storage helical domain-containing protein n=1 Tax=Physcomitrium patens TaxID=3218 RepID=A0A2K1JVA4_PHYPA|nr:non-specific lipid-transfer protein 5-like [Physcomitrium patens]PNR45458.1 hypothetical protein PHYPA_015229 [Physcomitrium patens]|eukprot:XP_024388405.1 non-specific lipid-transfer protein 5-like [Physcomitrella patens]